jgi:ribosome recycling factor
VKRSNLAASPGSNWGAKVDLVSFKRSLARVVEHFQGELASIHTGRPSPGLVDEIKVAYQGAELQIKQLATVTVETATSLLIAPWDRGNLAGIETAVREAGTGLSPVNTGEVVRVTVPPLSEERRAEYAKLVDAKAEQAKVSLRTSRHDALGRLKREWESAKTPEDERRRAEESLGRELAQATKQIDELVRMKKEELTRR